MLAVLIAHAAIALLAPLLFTRFGRSAFYVIAAVPAASFIWVLLQGGAAHSGQWQQVIPWLPTMDLAIALRTDSLAWVMSLIVLGIGALVLAYCARYFSEDSPDTGSFGAQLVAFAGAMYGLVVADDLLLLFIFWEITTVLSFLLIGYARVRLSARRASMQALIITTAGGLTMLVGVILLGQSAGTYRISELVAMGPQLASHGPIIDVAIALLLVGAVTKSALIPFHFWLPEAMAAATPVSAFLHAAAVVKAGIYLLLRFSTIFSDVAAWNYLLVITGLFTALMSGLFAITKTDLKHLTAYSTVSHLGWIVAAIGVGSPIAMAAALTHTLAHALFKSSLFMLIGVVDHEAGTRDMRRLGPIYNQMPFTFASTVIAAASMAAIPPLFGFVSKESILDALHEAPYGTLLLVTAGIAAFLTFVYSAKIVFGAFIDGPRDLPDVHEAPVALWLPAALPGLASAVLPFVLFWVDSPVSAGVRAITGDDSFATHLALWHGVTPPFIVSMLVVAAGVVFVLFLRKPVFTALRNKELLPADGTEVLSWTTRGLSDFGKQLGSLADGFNPSRHLFPLLASVVGMGLTVILLTDGIDGVTPAPRAEGLDVWWDLIPFAIIAMSVLGMVFTRSRLASAVLLGTVGVGMTLQMLMLGAPDVALTQFLVEALTVVVILVVLRFQPRMFPETKRRRKVLASVFALAAGVVTFFGVYGLTGRRERSGLAQWFLTEGGEVTGADNIVAVIIVEFRGFDTLGELSVLGMAAVVIPAVVSSVPRHLFEAGTRPRPFGQSQLNSIPLRKAAALVAPILVVLSVLIFFRGHTAPGGGFVAALVLATAFAINYLSRGADADVVKNLTPIRLTGWGIIIAISSGFLGFLEGGFMYAIHGEIAGEHLTTSLIFDFGIYLAVLGMVTAAINALGGYLRPGMDVSDLDYTRDEAENPLPSVPEPELPENPVDAHPEPINPAHDPQPVITKEL